MRRLQRSVVSLLAATALLLPVPAAQASHGDGPKFVAQLPPGSVISYAKQEGWCWLTGLLRMQEFGDHGVEQFKWRARAYDHKFEIGQDLLAGVVADYGWVYSNPFPGDVLDYQWTTPYKGWMRIAPTSLGLKPYAYYRVKAVGVRPSFWQRDLTSWVDIGECSYIDGMGVTVT